MKWPMQNPAPKHCLGAEGEISLPEVPKHGPNPCLLKSGLEKKQQVTEEKKVTNKSCFGVLWQYGNLQKHHLKSQGRHPAIHSPS